jgi:hypothetical protein
VAINGIITSADQWQGDLAAQDPSPELMDLTVMTSSR